MAGEKEKDEWCGQGEGLTSLADLRRFVAVFHRRYMDESWCFDGDDQRSGTSGSVVQLTFNLYSVFLGRKVARRIASLNVTCLA